MAFSRPLLMKNRNESPTTFLKTKSLKFVIHLIKRLMMCNSNLLSCPVSLHFSAVEFLDNNNKQARVKGKRATPPYRPYLHCNPFKFFCNKMAGNSNFK